MYYSVVQQFNKTLHQMELWLEHAEAHARDRSFDPSNYLSLRLAPDQFAFARQVQITCDTAKLATSRLTGKEAPKHPDTESSLDELRARIHSVREYLSGFHEEDFREAASRPVTQPRWEGKSMTGADYFVEHAIPNFFFHATLTYEILRHAGVRLGKQDYLGKLSLHSK